MASIRQPSARKTSAVMAKVIAPALDGRLVAGSFVFIGVQKWGEREQNDCSPGGQNKTNQDERVERPG